MSLLKQFAQLINILANVITIFNHPITILPAASLVGRV